MATRRNVTSPDGASSASSLLPATGGKEEKSDITPAVPTSVIAKLIGFTVAMIAGPIGIYFLSLNTIFNGNTTYAGATAGITANVVMVAYVIVAMREDQSDQREEAAKKAAAKRGKAQ